MKMGLISLRPETPWFFQHIENYNHLFLRIRSNDKRSGEDQLNFAIELDLQGFEGLLFFMYKPHARKIKMDILKHSIGQIHNLENLYIELNNSTSNKIDFVIIPFGYFKEEHEFRLNINSNQVALSFDIFSWSPSNLFKNVKSVIKIDNQYQELIPFDEFKGYYFQVEKSFKGNETGRLFDLINYLVELDKIIDEITQKPLFENMDSEIKSVISKSNEFLFELSQKSIPLELKNVLRELERLKFNIDNLSKEEIFNWLDNLIDFYRSR